MKNFVVFGFLNLLLFSVFAQKDSEAWKAQTSLEKQYKVLKENASSWNGHVMIKGPQLNTFHKSILDTVAGLEKTIVEVNANIVASKKEVNVLTKKLSETQVKLDASLSRESELVTLGIPFDKNAFPTIAYSIISVFALVAAFAFFMFFRSNAVTKEAKKRNEDLAEELQAQKTSTLKREAKLARELQTERNKNHSS